MLMSVACPVKPMSMMTSGAWNPMMPPPIQRRFFTAGGAGGVEPSSGVIAMSTTNITGWKKATPQPLA